MTDDKIDLKSRIVTAALVHVPFDGWCDAVLDQAASDVGVDAAMAHQMFPKGAVDLAVAFHEMGDAQLQTLLETADLASMRYSERVAFAIKQRLALGVPDREAVRRGTTLFALPMHSARGAQCVWHTADTIWNALGDTSDDYNWYSKRSILSGVYAASVLYWLGDESEDFSATSDFVDRRIEGVMAIESAKVKFRGTGLYRAFKSGPGKILDRITKPGSTPPADLPGHWGRKDV